MTLAELLKDVEVTEVQGNIDVRIAGITFDSKAVKPGYAFICIKGFKSDGHDFAADALERGAVAIVAERKIDEVAATTVVTKNTRLAAAKMAAAQFGHPYRRFKLLGVTGTNGKTTTTYLVKSILENCGMKVGLIGTNQNMIGAEILPSHHTTPDSVELMDLFAKMADSRVDVVVMEVSSHSLALDRVAACEFEAAAFTNVTQDHLDFHKTMENYIDAKAKLFGMCRTGVFNVDDDVFGHMTEKCGCEKIVYGVECAGGLSADNIEYSATGVKFDMSYGGEKVCTELSIPGKFTVYNALTAAGLCLAVGLSLKEVANGLGCARGVKGRIEVVKTDTDYTVIIDYAHTPDGLLNILNTIRGFAKGRVITLFGCGGDRDRTKRPIMGKIAGELSDFCVVTSDNPRGEEPRAIIEDILGGINETNCEYAVIENRFEAIEYALDKAECDDIILLAGKGHETYQILKDRTIVFDEREIVQKLIDRTDA